MITVVIFIYLHIILFPLAFSHAFRSPQTLCFFVAAVAIYKQIENVVCAFDIYRRFYYRLSSEVIDSVGYRMLFFGHFAFFHAGHAFPNNWRQFFFRAVHHLYTILNCLHSFASSKSRATVCIHCMRVLTCVFACCGNFNSLSSVKLATKTGRLCSAYVAIWYTHT